MIYVCIYIYISIYICNIYICIYIYIYIYIYKSYIYLPQDQHWASDEEAASLTLCLSQHYY